MRKACPCRARTLHNHYDRRFAACLRQGLHVARKPLVGVATTVSSGWRRERGKTALTLTRSGSRKPGRYWRFSRKSRSPSACAVVASNSQTSCRLAATHAIAVPQAPAPRTEIRTPVPRAEHAHCFDVGTRRNDEARRLLRQPLLMHCLEVDLGQWIGGRPVRVDQIGHICTQIRVDDIGADDIQHCSNCSFGMRASRRFGLLCPTRNSTFCPSASPCRDHHHDFIDAIASTAPPGSALQLVCRQLERALAREDARRAAAVRRSLLEVEHQVDIKRGARKCVSPVLRGIYEVVVVVTATAKLKDKVLFLGRGKSRPESSRCAHSNEQFRCKC